MIHMHDIDPTWQAEDETPVPVTVKNTVPQEQRLVQTPRKEISRRPAALVGVLLVIGIGCFVFFRGVSNLTGQLSEDTTQPVVHITADGLQPQELNVEHGQTITWINDTNKPEIIVSQTLCADTGYCLSSKSLFEGDSDTFSITPDMQAGIYDYTSATNPALTGKIIIVTNTVEDYQNVSSLLTDEAQNLDLDTTTVVSPTGNYAPNPTADDEFVVPATTQAGIPTNPYTADSQRMYPLDSFGNPIPEAFGDAPDTYGDSMEADIFSNGQGPLSQPQTGPELWIVIAGSIAGILFVTRNAFARYPY